MPQFGELDQYLDPGLKLTVKGTVYTVPLPSGELGLWCRRVAQVAGEISAASSEEEIQAVAERAAEAAEELPPIPGGDRRPFEVLMLGDAHAQMLADAVPDPYIQFCARTAYLWIVAGEEAAERFWTSGGRPEAPSPANRAERRALQRAGSSTTTSTGEARTTPSPGSGTGTNSRRSGSSRGRGSRGRRS